ncbi:SAM-dependent methyltransferase [Nocardia takedensis]|uniref:SAM-dependent methyltransferase n=1 Tax=Nocardia takedensis TaxID=259390 RepID=UPI003F767AC0
MSSAHAADRAPDACELIRTDVPHAARIWNYWAGGKDNYAVDHEVGAKALQLDPAVTAMVAQSRQFLVRAVELLTADLGVRQFLDIGCGLPAARNTHEIAQAIAPGARVGYVDNDPLVLTHARALLSSVTSQGVTMVIDADYHQPAQILADARAGLSFQEPIAVMLMGVLGYARSYADAQRIVATLMAAVPVGSYLLLWDATPDSPGHVAMHDYYATTGATPYTLRSQPQIRALFDGLDLVEPGFTTITRWRTSDSEMGGLTEVSAFGALGLKSLDHSRKATA